MKTIAFVARTVGLEFDDRIRKESLALAKKYKVVIYVNFADNRDEIGITSYGIEYRSFQLLSRDFFPSARFLLIKAFEFYIKVSPLLKEHDLVWAHEEYTFLFSLLYRKKPIIWDLHELPSWFLKSIFLKTIFKVIEKRVACLVHANNYRISFLKEKGYVNRTGKHCYIRNYPDSIFLQSDNESDRCQRIIEWSKGDPFVYLQGLSTPARYPYNTIAACLASDPVLKIVIAGKVDQESIKQLRAKYSDFDDRVWMLGMVDQLEIADYLRRAEFSIVLYKQDRPNNRYCEPNRLFQAIAMRIPVVVGCNETMSDIVRPNSIGEVLKDDGESFFGLVNSINKVRSNISFYKENLNQYHKNYVWSEDEVLRIVDDLI